MYELDEERIREEAAYDGFYAVVTNLEGDVREIININKRRWEIEENFRIMKTEFEARPVYVLYFCFFVFFRFCFFYDVPHG